MNFHDFPKHPRLGWKVLNPPPKVMCRPSVQHPALEPGCDLGDRYESGKIYGMPHALTRANTLPANTSTFAVVEDKATEEHARDCGRCTCLIQIV